MIQSVLILDSATRLAIKRVSIDSGRPESCNLLPGEILSPKHDGDIGWTLTENNEWVNPNPPTPYPQDQKVRGRRDKELEKSDVYMLSDFPITEAERDQWRQYRQALRDIPKQSGFPNEVIWPTPPE